MRDQMSFVLSKKLKFMDQRSQSAFGKLSLHRTWSELEATDLKSRPTVGATDSVNNRYVCCK